MERPVRVDHAADGTLGIELFGEIDFTNSAAVSDEVRTAVAEAQPGVVCVDMGSVTFLDSSGIGVLVIAYKSAVAVGADYRVVGPSPGVYEQLRLTGLVDLFGIDPPRVPVW
jgi:anti-anti-sigma factor